MSLSGGEEPDPYGPGTDDPSHMWRALLRGTRFASLRGTRHTHLVASGVPLVSPRVPPREEPLDASESQQRNRLPAPTVARRLRHDRGWLMRRALLVADLAALATAWTVAVVALAFDPPAGWVGVGAVALARRAGWVGGVLGAGGAAVWVVGAKLFGVYECDDAGAEH